MNVEATQKVPTGLQDHIDQRKRAEETAQQFEAILVRQMVSSLRQTASCGDEDGMFGSETGSDTYADWFDQHLSEHIGSTGQIGVKQAILDDLERCHQLAANETPAEVARKAAFLSSAADRSRFAAMSIGTPKGGIDVTR